MRKSIILLLAASALFSVSCASSKFYSSEASAINPIALVQPYSYITDAVDNWATGYRDDVTKINEELVCNAVLSAGIPVRTTVKMDYDKREPSALNTWMRKLGDTTAGSAKDLAVPDEIRRAVQESGCRYGLIVTDLGFLKNPDQYKTERAIETTAKVLGAIFSDTIEGGVDTQSCLNGVYALIFDNQSGKVVWFGSQPRKFKKNPLEPQTVNAQVMALFKDFK